MKTLVPLALAIIFFTGCCVGTFEIGVEPSAHQTANTSMANTAVPATSTYPSLPNDWPAPAISLRWLVALGSGSEPGQVDLEQAVVDDFNASQNGIVLSLEVVPYDSGPDTLGSQIAAGIGPDIVGPMGWAGSNVFHDQWADLSPYLLGFDTSIFNGALVSMYQTEEGQVALPFAVYPSVLFYQPALFHEAGLAYPPQNYGETYLLNGQQVEWSWETVGEVAKLLTLDANGNNATSSKFVRTQIVQYGYSPVWEAMPNYYGAYFTAGSLVQHADGAYAAVVPEAWKAAWEWYYQGIWGRQPYIPDATTAASPALDNGNPFASGRVAMAVLPNWYLCCLTEMADAGYTFQMGALPSYHDAVHGRIDGDTFRVWKGSHNIAQAVEVIKYLVTTGVTKLIVGSDDTPPAFGATPALLAGQQAFIDAKRVTYPFVTMESWDVMMDGLSYPDIPSAESYMPNYNEAYNRLSDFGDRMSNVAGLDLNTEIMRLESDLRDIFNK